MSTDLLPPSATPQERAISNTVARVGNVPNRIAALWNPYTCPIDILPWLAWSLSVDNWDPAWTELQKRDSIAQSVQVHRIKGTIGALKRALQAVGYEVYVNENTGEAYTFRLQIDASTQGLEDTTIYDEVERIALNVKNARSYLAGVDGYLQSRAKINILVATIDGVSTDVFPNVVTLISDTALVRILVGEQTIDHVTIRPGSLDNEFIAPLSVGGPISYDLSFT